ncbi:MAG TPA: DUF4136 domain-containing protein [Polyangiaceae bacterium]|nr:DUF4136 domain-containing protein [Polyangiaceae bacterium]
MGQTWGFRSSILATAAAGLLACHPASIDDASETDTVVTRRAEGYNYSQNSTFAIPAKIADLCKVDTDKFPIGEGGARGDGDSPDLDCNDITHAFDTQILDKLSRELEALGYVKVEASENPNLALLVGAISSNNWVAYTWYPYYPYYGWPPYYGWGIYYPYYPTTSVVNYPTGTLMMELVSLKDVDSEEMRTPSIWSGSVAGLLAQSDLDPLTRINRTIDQAFAQSPYLKVGNK